MTEDDVDVLLVFWRECVVICVAVFHQLADNFVVLHRVVLLTRRNKKASRPILSVRTLDIALQSMLDTTIGGGRCTFCVCCCGDDAGIVDGDGVGAAVCFVFLGLFPLMFQQRVL